MKNCFAVLSILEVRVKTHIYYLFLLLLAGNSLHAQLKGTHLLGDMGLQSGTQPPPSFTMFLPMYNYHTSTFVKANGDKIAAPDINMFLLGVGGGLVTNARILGGHYGASVLLAFASSKLEGNLVTNKSSLAFTDMYIQPLQLGWETKQADLSVGYAWYIPTGKYELGGSNNAGMGIFTHEFSAGSTVYFDAKKEWTVAALLSYALNGKKKNTGNNDIKVGDLFTIEGGLGKTWYQPVKGTSLPMVINAGMVYYMQFKTTTDKMLVPVIGSSTFELTGKDHGFALGAEASIFIPTLKGSIGLRWLSELGSRNRTQGNAFFVTLAPYVKFFGAKSK